MFASKWKMDFCTLYSRTDEEQIGYEFDDVATDNEPI